MENGSACEGHSGEDVSCHSGVDADAYGWSVEESADDIELLTEWLKWLKAFGQLHAGAFAFGSPVVWADSRSHELNDKALWWRIRLFGSIIRGAPDRHTFQPWECHCDACAMQEDAA
jgi:hypothetical protein